MSATAHAAPRPLGGLVLHQFRYELLAFWRNPQARFFTLALPVIFLVLLSSVFGNDTTRIGGHVVKQSTYYVGHIVALGVISTKLTSLTHDELISASFVNLMIAITTQRESGILKRRRAAPISAWVLITGRALSSVVISVAIVVLLIVVGRLAYGVSLPGHTLPALAVAVVLGSAAFCALAFGLASFVASADAAQPVTQAVVLPLYFISGIFIPDKNIPGWLIDVADVFPVRHLAKAMFTSFDPATHGVGFSGRDLLVVAGWGVAGLVVALWRFSWVPRSK